MQRIRLQSRHQFPTCSAVLVEFRLELFAHVAEDARFYFDDEMLPALRGHGYFSLEIFGKGRAGDAGDLSREC